MILYSRNLSSLHILNQWDATTSQDGNHTFKVTAYDLANNSTTSIVTFTVDNSPPTAPVIIDDGIYTTSLTTLHATWSTNDPQSDVVEYRYSIGTTKGGTDLVNWTSVGTDTEVTRTDLTLTQGKSYYFNVKAKNQVGLWSNIGTSDGIIANDGTTLLINITSLADNAILNTQTIEVKGTVSRNDAKVTVNGKLAQVIDNTFSCQLSLIEGTHQIIAKAEIQSQVKIKTIQVRIDTTPPSINILTPDKDSTTRSNIIYGRISDDAESVTVNDTPAQILENSYFLIRLSLDEGQNTLTIKAKDKAGNTNQIQHTFTYNTQTPKITITYPFDNSTINISPIKVEGATTQDIKFILVNSSTALIESNATFVAEGVTLSSPYTIIAASGYDANNDKFSDSILINTPELLNYELTKVLGDITEDDPNSPSAGSNQILKAKLDKNNQPAPNEKIQFSITQGNGALSSTSSFTDINGEATITLTTDINSEITNQVECFPTNNPLLKTTFSIDTKPGTPAILTKITDDSITPVPSVTIPLIVKLTDSNNNPIQDETINFQITQGTGTLSSPTATTTYYGEVKVNLTCPNVGLTLTQVKASSNTNPSINTTFNITTSAPLTVTVDDIINKVNANDAKIQDIKANITVTSNAEFLPPTMQLKIWQKGDKQKVEELSPNPQVKIRPIISKILQMNREIISSNLSTDIYIIKSKLIGQTEEYPYDLDHVDYQRGVIIKTERHFKVQQDLENLYIIEYLDFLQFGDVWGFQKIKETMYDGNLKEEYYIIKEYSNIQINTGIPDSEFN